MRNTISKILGVAALVLASACAGQMDSDDNQQPDEVTTPGEAQLEQDGCQIAGCSNELCLSSEQVDDVVTTCQWKAEYACYGTATCGKQANGVCGWSMTDELRACIAKVQ